MIEERLAGLNSWIHRLDPGVRIVSAMIVSLVAALSERPAALVGFLALSVILAGLARLEPVEVLRRLKPLFWFLVMIWLLVPITYDGTAVLTVGPARLSEEGLALCGRITVKSISILLVFMALVATLPVATLGTALHRLKVPDKLVFLLLMTYRYIAVIEAEYARLIRAARVRGFRPGTNLHSYRTIAYLAGMLFVRAARRADRVHMAMRCRGFKGRFHTLELFQADHRSPVFAVCIGLATLALFFINYIGN